METIKPESITVTLLASPLAQCLVTMCDLLRIPRDE